MIFQGEGGGGGGGRGGWCSGVEETGGHVTNWCNLTTET